MVSPRGSNQRQRLHRPSTMQSSSPKLPLQEPGIARTAGKPPTANQETSGLLRENPCLPKCRTLEKCSCLVPPQTLPAGSSTCRQLGIRLSGSSPILTAPTAAQLQHPQQRLVRIEAAADSCSYCSAPCRRLRHSGRLFSDPVLHQLPGWKAEASTSSPLQHRMPHV